MGINKNKRAWFFQFLRHNLFSFSVIFIVILSVIVIAGNVVVKEGAVTVDRTVTSTQFLDSSLIGYWKFNNNRSDDASSYGNSGSFQGGASAESDVLVLDGSNKYVSLGNSSTLNNIPTKNMTISAWIYDRQPNGNNWGTIFGSYNVNNGWTLRTFSNSTGSRSLYFQVPMSTAGASYQTLNGSIPQNSWVFVTAVWNNDSKTAKLFINGVEASYQLQTAGSGGYITETAEKEIGRMPHAGGMQYFYGYIDEVKLYSRSLSDWEVRQSYESQIRNLGHFNKIILGNSEIFWDGAKLVVNTNKSGSGIAWFSSNISATGYITRTVAWDTSRYGSALNYIRNDYIDSKDGEVDHNKYSPIEKSQFEEIDYSSCKYEKTGEIDSLTGQKITQQVCGTKIEQGTLLDGSVAKHEAAIYELNQKIKDLEDRLAKLEETCAKAGESAAVNSPSQ